MASTGEVGSMHDPERMLDQFEELTVLQSLLNNPGIYLREVQEEQCMRLQESGQVLLQYAVQ